MASVAERFEAKVDRSGGPDACHPWTASRNDLGYGQIRVGGKLGRTMLANRLAIELATGAPVPAGLLALHRCDRPECVNVRHLYVGTPKDNARDAVERGRHRRGSACRRATITESDVREIRALRRAGADLRDLAARFGLRYGNVVRIANGVRWAHVGE